MKIICPLYWTYGGKKKKTIPLCTNWYRNCYWRTLNDIKRDYTTEISKQFTGEKIKGTYGVALKAYLKSTAQDLDNFSSVAIKFTLDALVKEGIVEGDSNKSCTEIHSVFVGIDKLNPRIEIEII